jgi:hypothetical protein
MGIKMSKILKSCLMREKKKEKLSNVAFGERLDEH